MTDFNKFILFAYVYGELMYGTDINYSGLWKLQYVTSYKSVF